MRYVGPIAKRLEGPGADALLPLARKLLGITRNQMKLGGLKQGWGSLQLPDGSWLRCHSNQNGAASIDTVWIETGVTATTRKPRQGMLHGWLTGPLGDTWAVYVWDELAAVLTAQGVVIDSKNSHSFSDGSRSPSENPEEFTGLTRLLAQSLVARNRSLSHVFPLPEHSGDADWRTSKHLGCVRAPDGGYWLVSAGPDGVFVGKLAVPSSRAADFMLAESGTLSGLEQEMLDAKILAYVEAPTETLALLTAAEVAPLWTDDFLPLTTWGWRYQKRGAADASVAGAVIVVKRNRIYPVGVVDYDSNEQVVRHGELTFSWGEDGVPSAALVVNPDGADSWWADIRDISEIRNGASRIIQVSRGQWRRTQYKDRLDYLPWPDMPTGEKCYSAWYGSNGAHYKLVKASESNSPEFNISQVACPEASPPSTYWQVVYAAIHGIEGTLVQRCHSYDFVADTPVSNVPMGWRVQGSALDVFFAIAPRHTEAHLLGTIENITVECVESGQYRDYTYHFTQNSYVNRQDDTYEFRDGRSLGEIDLFISAPGLYWIVIGPYIKTTSHYQGVEVHQNSIYAGRTEFVNGVWEGEEDIRAETNTTLLTIVADAETTTDVVEYPAKGYVVVDTEIYELTEAQALEFFALVDDMGLSTYYQYELPCFPGYGARNNVRYVPYPSGFNIDGAQLVGRWVGCA